MPTTVTTDPSYARRAAREGRHALILAHAILGVDLDLALAGIADGVVEGSEPADIHRLGVLLSTQARLRALGEGVPR